MLTKLQIIHDDVMQNALTEKRKNKKKKGAPQLMVVTPFKSKAWLPANQECTST